MIDSFKEAAEQFLNDYENFKNCHDVIFTIKTQKGTSTIEIYEVINDYSKKRIIKVEEESLEEAYRAGAREIKRFIYLENYKKEKKP